MFYKLRLFIPIAIVITGICGLIHLVVQQSFRQGANDPQIQQSEDSALYLKNNGDLPFTFPPGGRVNMNKSLATFLIEYDEKGKVVNSTGELDGDVPNLPQGVLDFAKKNNQNRITWEPEKGVRIATVVTYFNGKSSGFVLAGRNLREVEMREANLQNQILLGWLIIMVATFIGTLIFAPSIRKK